MRCYRLRRKQTTALFPSDWSGDEQRTVSTLDVNSIWLYRSASINKQLFFTQPPRAFFFSIVSLNSRSNNGRREKWNLIRSQKFEKLEPRSHFKGFYCSALCLRNLMMFCFISCTTLGRAFRSPQGWLVKPNNVTLSWVLEWRSSMLWPLSPFQELVQVNLDVAAKDDLLQLPRHRKVNIFVVRKMYVSCLLSNNSST